MRTLNGYFSKKSSVFHALVHALLTLGGMKFKFGGMFIHKKDGPRCEDTLLRLDNAFTTAVPFAAALLEEYFNTLPTIAENERMNEFFQNNYTGGAL
jgi:hypothetical protein